MKALSRRQGYRCLRKSQRAFNSIVEFVFFAANSPWRNLQKKSSMMTRSQFVFEHKELSMKRLVLAITGLWQLCSLTAFAIPQNTRFFCEKYPGSPLCVN